MNRRRFLSNLGVVGLAVVLGDTLITSCTDPNSSSNSSDEQYKVWVWLSVNRDLTKDKKNDTLKRLKKHGVSGILFGGYDSDYFTIAHDLGLEAHVWMWTLNRGDKELMANHADWYSINRLGDSCHDAPPYVDYYRWLCPSRPEVLDYLVRQVDDLSSKPEVDGVHLDYIRFCDVILPRALWEKYDLVQDEELPQFDYCYCAVCRRKFKEQEGVDPLELEDPPSQIKWLQFRYDAVTNIVNNLSAQIRANDKQVSAAVFPTPSIAKRLVRQDWLNWDLDMIFPMVYHGFYEEDIPWIETAVREGVDGIAGKYPMYAGLYMPDIQTPENLKLSVAMALKGGAKGVSVFGSMGDEHLSVLSEFGAKA